MKNERTTVLEPSTNTHVLDGNVVSAKELASGTIVLDIVGRGIVSHGEHGTVITEKSRVVKYVQQEVNPITKKLQNAFD